jgi:hypothetical protein
MYEISSDLKYLYNYISQEWGKKQLRQKNKKFYWRFSSAVATAKLEFLTTEAHSKAKYSIS